MRDKIAEHILQEGKITVVGNVLQNVKLLGLVSGNNRIYQAEAVQKAVPMYEGCKSNLNHDHMRSVENRFARVKNARFEGNELRGDLVCNPAHPFFPTLKWWAENDPGAIGMSHVVDAEQEAIGNGQHSVTKIYSVEAVDIVADPATTKGLGESMSDKLAADKTGTVQVPAGTNITIHTNPATGEQVDAKAAAAFYRNFTPGIIEPITESEKAEKAEASRQKELAAKGAIYEEAIKVGLAHTHIQGAFLEQLLVAPNHETVKRWLEAKKAELATYGLVTPAVKPPVQNPPADPNEPVILTQEQFVARLTH